MFFDHFSRFIPSYDVLLKKYVDILVQNNEMRRMSSPPSKSDQYWGYKGTKENAIQKQIRVRVRVRVSTIRGEFINKKLIKS